MLSLLRKNCFEVLAKNARCFSQAKPLISEVQRQDNERCLFVKWNDGTTGKYAYPWLIDNGSSSYSVGSRNRARTLLMSDLDTTATPTKAQLSDDGQSVSLTWPFDQSPHTFESDWLLARNLGDSTFREQRRLFVTENHESWGPEDFKKRTPADFGQMMTDDIYLRDRLCEFLKYGIMQVKNAPIRPNALQDIGQRCGYLLNQHHGKHEKTDIFEVVVEIDPCNLMNTPRALGLHTDLPQYQQPPEIQILHVVEQAGSGGENQFCDGFRVAQQLQQEKPEVFQLLTKHLIEYIDWGEYRYKYRHVARWRTIELDNDGRLYGIFFNNQVRGWFWDAPPEDMPKLYDALRTFYDYCYQPRNMIETKMMPGDMTWFANNRVLHGRSAFELEQSGTKPVTRHLEGCFVSFDVIRSKIRVINEAQNENVHASL